MNIYFFRMTLLGCLFASLACTSARAFPVDPADSAAAPAAASASAESPAPSAAPVRKVDGLGAPLAQDRLATSRGGADTANSTAQLGATVANNSASNLSSGNNIIDGGSFANMSGLPMVIQNSGANVLIQNATVINLQLR